MRGNVDRRLGALERVAAPMLGFRYFQQSGADPDIYEESATGQALTLFWLKLPDAERCYRWAWLVAVLAAQMADRACG